MGKVISVASGKGGTGKTTTVAAVSSCLAALGYKTLSIDFDTGMKNLDLSLCMADFTVSDYMDVHSGNLDLMEACHEHPKIPNLFFLAAPSIDDTDKPDELLLRSMFDEIKGEFDYCFVDSPSGMGEGFRLAHLCADVSIIVTNGELPAMRDAQIVADAVRGMGVFEVRLLVNRVISDRFRKLSTTIDDVIDSVGAQLLGIVREDEAVTLSLHENTPLILYRKRRSAYDFLDAARRLSGEDLPLMNMHFNRI